MEDEGKNERFVCSDASVRADITQLNQLVSPFLKFPAEIRNVIYELAFANGIVIVRQFEPETYHGFFALLHICRQIRFELLPIFYHHATLHLGRSLPRADESKLFPFTGTSIKSIQLDDDSFKQDPYIHDFGKMMPNIEDIHIDFESSKPKYRARFRSFPRNRYAREAQVEVRELLGNQHVKLHYTGRRKTIRTSV